MVAHLWLLQRPGTHQITHPNTKIPNVSQSCVVSEAVCVCVRMWVWLHFCICLYFYIFTWVSSLRMCWCVGLRRHCASWWQTGSQEAEALNEIGADSLHWCCWKIWLFSSSGMGGGFDISAPSLWQFTRQNKVYRNGQMFSEEEKEEGLAPPPQLPASVPPLTVPCDRMSALFKCKNNPPAFWYKHMNLVWLWRKQKRWHAEGSGGTVNES